MNKDTEDRLIQEALVEAQQELNDGPPFGIAALAQDAFAKSLTLFGAMAILAGSILYCYSSLPDMPLLLRLIPALGYALIVWFFLFVFSIVASLGDAFAAFVLQRMFGASRPTTTIQRIAYFALSSVGFVIAAVFVSLGDSPLTRALDQ